MFYLHMLYSPLTRAITNAAVVLENTAQLEFLFNIKTVKNQDTWQQTTLDWRKIYISLKT
jgi:hypothetical protein